MVLGWRQWWRSTLWYLNWLQRLLPLFSLPVLYLHKQFSDFQLLLLQISNRRSGRRAISSPIWCCVHRSLTSSQTCRDHYQQRRKKFTRKKHHLYQPKSTVDKKRMAIKHKEVTTNFNQSLTVNNTYIQNISNEIFLWYPKTCWQ